MPRLARRRLSLFAAALAAAATLVVVAPAQATYPGRNGRIVFQAQVGDHEQLFTVRPDGTGLRQLTAGNRDSVYADWSPDGRRIAFEVDTPDAVQIYVMRADGTRVTDLGPFPGCCSGQPAYTPDGRRIVFSRVDPLTGVAGLWIMDANGANPRQLFAPWPGKGDPDNPTVSPDGRRLSWVGHHIDEPSGGLFTSTFTGGDLRQLLPFGSDQSLKNDWAPDGSRLLTSSNANFIHEGDSTNIVTIRPDGTDLLYLTHFRGGQVNAFAGSYSPDGRWIVFRQEDHGRYALERMRPNGTDRHVILPFSPTLLPRSSQWGPRR